MKRNVGTLVATSGLIVGNLIGAGILALPISLGITGFIPSYVSLFIYTAMMMFTAYVITNEVAEAKDPNFDYPSLYEKYLGKIGKWVAIIANAVILYGVLIAYLSGGAQIIMDTFNIHGSPMITILIFALAMVILTLFDLSIISKYNTVLIIILISAFIVLISLSCSHISLSQLAVKHWEYFGITIPLVVTAAHFHNIIPTLCENINWDVKTLKKSISIGMGIALVMNSTWTLCGIGCLPRTGENSLMNAYINNVPATVPMSKILDSQLFFYTAVAFSLFAIITSFLANGLGLVNFIKDLLYNAFKINKKQIIYTVTFLPPILVAITWPHIFIKALNIVGGIGIVTLFGVLPCLIAIKKKGIDKKYRISGIVFFILSMIALLSVIASLFGIGSVK